MTVYKTTQTSVVEDLKNLLRDRYRSGFPVFKELLQNADDAGARRLVIKGSPGFPEAANPLLQVPCLIVANDGPVSVDHFAAMERSSGGSKAAEAGTVGRFGLGQKAVFHLCDAFVAQGWVGAGAAPEQKIMNPWEAIPGAVNAASTWQQVHAADRDLLERWFGANGFGHQGLMLVLPLRTPAFGPGGGFALTEARWTLSEALEEISSSDELATALCCLRNLRLVEIEDRTGALQRYEIDAPAGRLSSATARRPEGRIGGRIARGLETDARFVGREAWTDGGAAASLRGDPNWPHSFDLHDQRHPQKAEPHGAALLCRGGSTATGGALRIHWAVFLPVQGEEESLSLPSSLGTIDLLLHGYFFVDSARTLIRFGGSDADGLEERWNRAVRDETTLPLVLDVLGEGLAALVETDAERQEILAALDRRSAWFGKYREQVCGARALAFAWNGTGAPDWRIVDASGLRPVPATLPAGVDRLERTFPGLGAWCLEREIMLSLGSPLASRPPIWADEELASLVALAGASTFQRAGSAELVAALLDSARAAIGPATRAALAAALRAALLDAATPIRASDAAMRQLTAVLTHIPLLRLPHSVRNRPIMKALAEVRDIIPVRADWWEGGGTRLPDTTAIDLLTAMAPFVGNNAVGEEAAAVISQVLKYGPGLPTLAANARARDLAIVPAVRVLDKREVTLTIAEAQAKGEAGCLFSGLSNRLLDTFAEAVLDPAVYRVKWPADGEGPLLQSSAPSALIRALQGAVRFGEPAARGRLANQLGELAEPALLRSLCAGIFQLGRDTRLYDLDQLPVALAPLVEAMRGARARDLLLEPALTAILSGQDRERLEIARLDSAQLGQWLSEAHRAGQLPDLSDDVAQALLISGIDPALLAPLPLHQDQRGMRVALADGLYQAGPGTVPASLLPFVHLLAPWRDDRVEAVQRRLVPRWSPHAQIEASLATPAPREHLAAIVAALGAPGIDLARHADRLRAMPWLPIGSDGTAPQQVLDLAPAVDTELRRLLGPACTASTPADLPQAVRAPAVIEALRHHGILPGRPESLERAGQMAVAVGAVACLVDPLRLMDSLRQLARRHIDLALPAWPLLAEVLQGDDAPETVLAFATCLTRIPSAALALEHLNALGAAVIADHAASAARLLHGAVFTAHIAIVRNGAFLPADLLVPSMAGNIVRADQLALAASGVDRAHMLARDYVEAMHAQMPEGREAAAPARGPVAHGHLVGDLAARLEPWRHVAPADAVLFLLALLGRDQAMQTLAQGWEQQRSFARICDDIDDLEGPLELLTPFAARLAELEFEIADNDGLHVEVLSAAGSQCVVPLGTDGATWLVDIMRLPTYRREPEGPLRHPYRLSIAPVRATDEDAARGLFEQFVTKLAPALCVAFAEKRTLLVAALLKCFASDQAALAETEAELQRVIDDRLRNLKVKGAVKEALRAFDQCQHRDPEAGQRLWAFVRSAEAAPEMLSAVRAKIVEMGYSDDRVLFELFQNADDALRHWSMAGDPRFRVEVRRDPQGIIVNLRVIHWGRLLNDLGQDREAGIQNDYHRDLASMLAIGQSGKEGDGQTGRFGLGFKTVHMLSDSPGIASGRISARINGGMVPVAWEDGRQQAGAYARRGEQPTLIDLPIPAARADAAARALQSFRAAAAWLPAIAPRLRQIEIVDAATDDPVLGCAPMAIAEGVDLVTLGSGRRAFRLQLRDGFQLMVALGIAGPERITGVSALWHLVPLDEEERRSDWLIDGRFRVNPGRTHIIGSLQEKADQFAALSDSLGERLLGLFDAIDGDWGEFCRTQGLDAGAPTAFWTRLIDMFARDLMAEPERFLHSNGGLARLLSERALVPLSTGALALATAVRWRRAGALADPAFFTQIRAWPAFQALAEAVVDEDRALLLNALGLGYPHPLTLTALVERMLDGGPVGPVEATALGVAITAEAFQEFPLEERGWLLQFLRSATFLAEDGSAQLIRQLSFPQSTDRVERARAAFAPASARLSAEYAGGAVALAELARREAGHNQYVWQTWVRAAADAGTQEAFLRYLLLADREMAQYLYAEAGWAPDMAALPYSPLLSGWSFDDRHYLMAQLGSFPGAFDDDPEDDAAPSSPPDPAMALDAIANWWADHAVELRAAYQLAAYPEGFSPLDLTETEADEPWFTMFGLATFQTLGRITPEQSRGFVGRALAEGWWRDLAHGRGAENLDVWLRRLHAWSEPWEVVDFMTWRRCLVDLYAIVRYLPQYRRLFVSLPRILDEEGEIALRDLLIPTSSHIVSRMGINAAPLAQSLGLGANWMIRELSRAGVYGAEPRLQLEPYGWSTTRRVRSLFRRLGATPEHGPDHGRYLHDYVAARIGVDRARFLGDMDLPLQLITTSCHRMTLEAILVAANVPVWGLDLEEDDE